MTYEYEHQMVAWADVASVMTTRGAAGWKLAAAFPHDNQIIDGEPYIIFIWEKAIP